MSENKDIIESRTAAAPSTDGAVGVPNTHWYVAIMKRPRSEKAAAEALAKQGYNVYVATQKKLRVWSRGRRTFIDNVVIPGVVFIKCTEAERLKAAYSPYIAYYMINRANKRKIAVIPDNQMTNLQFMLGQSDIPVEFTTAAYKLGDKVRVVRGTLKGLEGVVYQKNNSKSELVINIDYLGCAKIQIDTINLEIIKEKPKVQPQAAV